MSEKAGPCSCEVALSGTHDGRCVLVARKVELPVHVGQDIRTLNVLDDYNHQLLRVETDFSLPASRVVQTLTRLVDCHGYLAQLHTDNGPEFISARLSDMSSQAFFCIGFS